MAGLTPVTHQQFKMRQARSQSSDIRVRFCRKREMALTPQVWPGVHTDEPHIAPSGTHLE